MAETLFRERTDKSAEVTPIELFFDLVFVFAITQISHLLLHHLDKEGRDPCSPVPRSWGRAFHDARHTGHECCRVNLRGRRHGAVRTIGGRTRLRVNDKLSMSPRLSGGGLATRNRRAVALPHTPCPVDSPHDAVTEPEVVLLVMPCSNQDLRATSVN